MEMAGPLLNPGQFLVEVTASSRNLSKITLVVDGDAGVTIDDCSHISRELSKKLDEIDFGIDRYVLEVTTPGLEHPLKLKRQFCKNVGRGLKVHHKDKTIMIGKLAASDEEKILLRQELREGKVITEREVVLRFEDIEKAFVIVSFK